MATTTKAPTTAKSSEGFKGIVSKVCEMLKAKEMPVEAVEAECKHCTNKVGTKIPKYSILMSVVPETAERIKITFLDYKKDYEEGSAVVPNDFTLKTLTGDQGKKMMEKYANFKNKPDFEIALSVCNDKNGRPRRTSLHTLAHMLGRTDPLALAKEMQASGKVVGYVCPDVKTPIFYLKSMVNKPTMIDSRDDNVWGKLEDFLKVHPFEKVWGFKRFASGGTWSEGYGKGKYTPTSSAMEKPYEADDYPYARKVIEALRAAGFTPGITEDMLK